jgi:hypothetical protein
LSYITLIVNERSDLERIGVLTRFGGHVKPKIPLVIARSLSLIGHKKSGRKLKATQEEPSFTKLQKRCFSSNILTTHKVGYLFHIRRA